MAYPQFALVTLQLIAPSSNMTLQEYKDAYGIDLTVTDIHAFKLVLFGGEKYAIDQIKDVEGGHEVYFNGHILSITDIVQTSGEVYDVANATPLYIHPLDITGSNFRISCLIFNNSATPFTKETLVDYIEALYAKMETYVRIPCTGGITIEGAVYPVVFLFRRPTGDPNTYGIAYKVVSQSDNQNYVNAAALLADIQGVNDGVNKIN